MREVRGLIVDDEARKVKWLTNCFDAEFEKYEWKVAWERQSVPLTAQRLIRVAIPFHFAVIDLVYPRDDLPDETECRGLDLISEVCHRSDRTFVFAISGGDPAQPNLFDLAKRHGAHHVTHRAQFKTDSTEHSPAAVCAEIREFLLNNGTVTEVEVRADANDPAVQTLLHEVGVQTVAQLNSRILAAYDQRSHKIEVGFLTPGVSGASVCSVTAEVDGTGTFRHALKISRAHAQLRTEATNAALAGRLIPSRFFVRHSPEQPVGPVNGWYALGSQLQDPAITLRRWLATGPGPNVVEDVLEELFLEGLKPLHEQHIDEEDHCAVDEFGFPVHQQLEILQTLDDLRDVLARPDGGRMSDVADLVIDLTSFVRESRLDRRSRHELPSRTWTTLLHGDLHGGNILVYQGIRPRPMLLDASAFGRGHWAKDPARLAVDILVRNFDMGADSFLFARFDVWRALAGQIGELGPLTASCPTPAAKAALTALNWLVTHLRDYCVPLATDEGLVANLWEWRVAVLSRLLRTACYVDVPAPKRAVAIVAAYDQWQAAGKRR